MGGASVETVLLQEALLHLGDADHSLGGYFLLVPDSLGEALAVVVVVSESPHGRDHVHAAEHPHTVLDLSVGLAESEDYVG